MAWKNRLALHFEQLESRLNPGVTRAVGTLQIVDSTVNPTYEWASPAKGLNNPGNAIGTDHLAASLDMTYSLTGAELATSLKTGITFTQERIGWLEADTNFWGKRIWESIWQVGYEVTFRAPAGTVGTYTETIVIPLGFDTTNDAWKDEGPGDAEYYGWLDNGEGRPVAESKLITGCIQLKSVAAPGPDTGGTPGQAPLRARQGEITKTELVSIPSPDLPVLAAGGDYKILTFNSPNGADFTFTAANTAGYGLFAASSLDRVEDPNDPDGDWILDPDTMLSAVYPNGSPYAGDYSGTNNDLVVRNNAGTAHLLSAYTYSEVPPSLLDVPDGQTVPVAGDEIQPGDGMLWLLYETGEGTQGFVIIPTASPDPQLSVSDVTVTEGNSGTTDASFTVTLSAPAASDVTVGYSTAPGTASTPSDFTSVSGTLTFLAGETSKTVNVPVIGDTTYEPDEDFFLNLGSATNADIADGAGQGTILNDDSEPTISIDDVIQSEGNGGTTSFVFTVTLSNPSWETIMVDFATADWSATAGSDYAASSGTLTFLPGETSETITITVYGDATPEAASVPIDWPYPSGEGFYLNLSAPTNSTLLDAQGLGWIVNDD